MLPFQPVILKIHDGILTLRWNCHCYQFVHFCKICILSPFSEFFFAFAGMVLKASWYVPVKRSTTELHTCQLKMRHLNPDIITKNLRCL